jgi:Leucine-rich repeat (LRR) protein
MTDITESANIYDYQLDDKKLIYANGNKYISIYENDLKYRKHNNIDLSRVRNVNHYDRDTLKYRLYESEKDNYKTLDLSHLDLKTFPEIPKNIAIMVKYLFLSENRLEVLQDLSFMESLVVVDLCNNILSSVPKLPHSIEEILIKNNNINNINSLAEYPFLKRTDCSNNFIRDIPIIDSLEILICKNNNIDKIPNRLNKLRKLICSDNEISYIDSLISLQVLEIDNNKLETIKNTSRLKELYCSNNLISSIVDLNKIEVIHCHNTNIRKLDYYNSLSELMCDYKQDMILSSMYTITSSDIFDEKIMMIVFK